jgi:hypothetical protein
MQKRINRNWKVWRSGRSLEGSECDLSRMREMRGRTAYWAAGVAALVLVAATDLVPLLSRVLHVRPAGG